MFSDPTIWLAILTGGCILALGLFTANIDGDI